MVKGKEGRDGGEKMRTDGGKVEKGKKGKERKE